MKKKITTNYIVASSLLLLFLIFTILLKFVDYRAVGPNESSVGFASINLFFSNLIGVHTIFYKITDWLGIIAIAVAIGFACLGVFQVLKRKSIKKVDYQIYTLGVLYIAVVICYIFFEKCNVNFRPVLIDGELEASYPSSHTMIVSVIMISSMFMFSYLIKNKKLKIALDIFCISFVAFTVVGRVISGVHWITDIIGGLMLACSLVLYFYATVLYIEYEKKD